MNTKTTAAQNPVFQPFTNNTIPASLLNSNAQALLTAGGKYGGIFPAPNNGTQFQGGNNLPTNVREEIVRIDENVTDKFTIFGHFVAEQVNQNYGTTMWSGDNVPSIGNTFGNPSYAAVVHAAYVISPNVVNEASFSYNGNRIAITPLAWLARQAISRSTVTLTGRTRKTASPRSSWVAAPDRNTRPTGRHGTTWRTATSFAMMFPGPRAGTS